MRRQLIPRRRVMVGGGVLCCVLSVASPAFDRGSLRDTYVTAVADLEYLLEPEEGSRRTPRPLCVVLPGGPGSEQMAQGAMRGMGKQFAQRGWAVAVPIAGNEKSFIGRNGELVPKLIRDLQRRNDITNDRVLIAGISNGGIASMEIAADHPELFCAVIVAPGIVSQYTRVERLKDMPIYLRVGEHDRLNWGYAFPRDEKRLREAGAILDARLLKDVGHGIPLNWQEIDAWLLDVAGENVPAQLRSQERPPVRVAQAEDRELRRWRSKTGNTVVASLLEADSGYAILRLQSGSTVQIEVDQLSSTDQRYLLQFAQ